MKLTTGLLKRIIEEEIEKLEEQEEQQQPEPSNSEYNPLNEPVKQRSYTGGIVTNNNPIINNQVMTLIAKTTKQHEFRLTPEG